MLYAPAPGKTWSTVLWGSDWPHPNQYDEMHDDGDLLDAFAQWVPEDDLRRQILVENPAALYGFG